jgi:ADP-ribosylglycohydrolase
LYSSDELAIFNQIRMMRRQLHSARQRVRQHIQDLGKKYPQAGYGGMCYQWLYQPGSTPYQSYSNGSAMRVSPVGFAFETLQAVLTQAREVGFP